MTLHTVDVITNRMLFTLNSKRYFDDQIILNLTFIYSFTNI